MLCNKLVIAAFIALVHQVTAAPVDARNKPVKQPQGYVFKGNDHNVFVAGTAAGGDGGQNIAYTNGAAVPIVINGGYRGSGNIVAEAYQANSVSQSANGGGAVVAGVARNFDDEDMAKRGSWSPPAPVIKGNDRNVFVVGTAQGGAGGENWAYTSGAAVPIVYSGKGYTHVSAEQVNQVGQSANGGGAVVAGKYRRDEEELEARKFAFPTFVDNNGNTVVVGSATGGAGGENWAYTSGAAAPIVYSGKGHTYVSAEQVNQVGQSANGGGAVVAGKYRRGEEELEARKYTAPSFIDNNGNTVVFGSATGGAGGMNWASTSGAAVPVVISEGSKHGSYQDVSAFQMNTVSQSANGGSAAVIGKA